MAELDAALQGLQASLDRHAPDLASGLCPGLEPEALAAAAAALPFALPPALAALYAWHDGQPYGSSLHDYFQFYPLVEAVDEYLQLRAVSRQLEAEHGFCSWPEGLLPLLGFEGEYLALACQDLPAAIQQPGAPPLAGSAGVLWYAFIEDTPRYWFDSLAGYLDFLAAAYASGALAQGGNGRSQADPAALHALRLARVSSRADQERMHA